MILCVPNNGAVKGLEDTDVVEISCTIKNGNYYPHEIEPDRIPMEMIRRVKMYERLASEAIREKSIEKAIDCLMVHPLVNSYTFAKKLAYEYMKINEAYMKGWS